MSEHLLDKDENSKKHDPYHRGMHHASADEEDRQDEELRDEQGDPIGLAGSESVTDKSGHDAARCRAKRSGGHEIGSGVARQAQGLAIVGRQQSLQRPGVEEGDKHRDHNGHTCRPTRSLELDHEAHHDGRDNDPQQCQHEPRDAALEQVNDD